MEVLNSNDKLVVLSFSNSPAGFYLTCSAFKYNYATCLMEFQHKVEKKTCLMPGVSCILSKAVRDDNRLHTCVWVLRTDNGEIYLCLYSLNQCLSLVKVPNTNANFDYKSIYIMDGKPSLLVHDLEGSLYLIDIPDANLNDDVETDRECSILEIELPQTCRSYASNPLEYAVVCATSSAKELFVVLERIPKLEKFTCDRLVAFVYKRIQQCSVDFDLSSFFPADYIPVIICWIITSQQSSPTVIAWTTLHQIVMFKDGRFLDCLQLDLPCQSSSDATLLLTERYGKLGLVALCTSKEVFIVDLDEFQIIHHFGGYDKVFSADFLYKGYHQYILIECLSSNPYQWKGVLLVDRNTIHGSERENQVQTVGENDGLVRNMGTAAKALQSQLQMKMSEEVDLANECIQKEAFIETTCQTLQSMALGKKVSPKSNLLVFLEPASESSVSDSRLSCMENSNLLDSNKIESDLPWKLFYDGQVIFGVDILNHYSRTLEGVRLLVLPSGHKAFPSAISQSSTQLFSTSTVSKERLIVEPVEYQGEAPKNTEPSGSRKRLKVEVPAPVNLEMLDELRPGHRASAVTSMKIPEFNVGESLEFQLILQWHMPHEALNFAQVSERSDEQPGNYTASMGTVRLHAMDSLAGKDYLQNNASALSLRELMCLDACQETYNLKLTSQFSTVACWKEWFSQLGFVPNELGLICERNGPLLYTRVRVNLEDKDQLNILVSLREESVLFMFIHALNKTTPDDILVTMSQSAHMGPDVEVIKRVLHAELNYLSTRLQELAQNSKHLYRKKSPGSTLALSKESPSVTEIREDFKKQQENLLKSEHCYVDRVQYSAFLSDLEEFEKKSNSCFM